MERFEEQRRADAPIQHAWDILVSAEHAPEWVPFVSTATTRGEPGIGRVQVVTGSLLGISMDIEQTVDVWEPPHHFGWTAPDPFLVRVRVDLAEADADTTEITAVIEADLARFPVGKRIAARTVKRQFRKSADALVALLERTAKPGADDVT